MSNRQLYYGIAYRGTTKGKVWMDQKYDKQTFINLDFWLRLKVGVFEERDEDE